MRLYVGQVPLQPLVITVLDGLTPVDLGLYADVDLLLTDPDGEPVDTSAGFTSVDDGRLKFVWPLVTLFPSAGDYRMTVRASGPGVLDYSDPYVIEVLSLRG